jgi:thiamine-phosphate pyrophosphorylase
VTFPPLYPILDAVFLPASRTGRDEFLRALTASFAEAGVRILQYRNKQGRDIELLADALVLRHAATASLKLIMNDRPDLAVRAGFDGVHVGQDDTSAALAREIIGPDRILGVSTHNAAQLAEAAASAADYLAIGPVFPTSSKQDTDPVVGLEAVRAARSLTRKPLVAIGGITLTNAPFVRQAGADSVAVISSLFGCAETPAKLAKDFLRIFR